MKSRRTHLLSALFAVVFFIQSSWTLAQFNYGLRVGGQLTTLHSNDDRRYTSELRWRPAYHGGLFLTYQFSDRFSAVADFLYSDKGYRIGNDYNVHMEYLSIPVMAQYHFNSKFSMLVGIESNLFLGAYEMYNGVKERGTGYDRRTTFAVGGGVAYQVNPRLNVMARYFHGVSNAAGENRQWIPGFKIDSRVIQLSLGYFYRREEDKAYTGKGNTIFSIGARQGVSKYVLVKKEHYPDGKIEASSGRNGYQAEIDFRFTRRRFHTSIGIVYSQKGGVVPEEDLDEIGEDFISIPFVFGYSPLRTKYLSLALEVGFVYNHLVKSKNLPEKVVGDFSSTSDDLASGLYGFELSTDVFSRITPFISYRKEMDISSFYQWSGSVDYYYDLYHSGQILSLGVRLRGISIPREK